MATPSPAPGVGDSPFVTWGRLDATPLRLDPLDVPIDSGAGAGRLAFTMAPPAKRGAWPACVMACVQAGLA